MDTIYLDISKDEEYNIRRDDQNYPNRESFLEITIQEEQEEKEGRELLLEIKMK